MIQKLVILLIVLKCCAILCIAQETFSGSTVRIYCAIPNSKKAKSGTGFVTIISGKRYIVTCYHVVSGSSNITIFSSKEDWLENVKIVGYDDVKDIAILETKQLVRIKPIPLSTKIPTIKDDAYIIGNSGAFNEQVVPVKFSSPNGIVSSKTLRDVNANPVMKASFDFPVIPLFTTAYGGMSGSPVINNGEVVGIFQGSVETGGAYSWAVPVSIITTIPLNKSLNNGLSLAGLKSLEPLQKFLIHALNTTGESEFQLVPVNNTCNTISSIINHITNLNNDIDKRISFIDSLRDKNSSRIEWMDYLTPLVDSIVVSKKLVSDVYKNEKILKQMGNQIIAQYNENFKNKNIVDSSLHKLQKDVDLAFDQLKLAEISYVEASKYEREHPGADVVFQLYDSRRNPAVYRLNYASEISIINGSSFRNYLKLLPRFHQTQNSWFPILEEYCIRYKALITRVYERKLYN